MLIGLWWLIGPAMIQAQTPEASGMSETVPPAGHDQGMPAATDGDIELTLEVDPPDATVFLEGARFEGSRSERVFFLKPGWYRFPRDETGIPRPGIHDRSETERAEAYRSSIAPTY